MARLLLVIIVVGVGLYFYLAFSGGIHYEPTAAERSAAEAKVEQRILEDKASREQRAAEMAQAEIRLVRENHKADDGIRTIAFKSSLKDAGQRCDSVRRAVMGAPGVWTIDCAPGYTYQLIFDAEGNPTKILRAK